MMTQEIQNELFYERRLNYNAQVFLNSIIEYLNKYEA
jgi:hypothetical protein